MAEPSHKIVSSSASVPAERTDTNSRIAHEQLVAKAKAGRIDLYFLGDSITRRWGCSDPQWAELLAHWKANFHGWNAGNFGWGGDRIENILWRIENGELEGVNPKVIVILAGTNNIGTTPGGNAKMSDIIAGYEKLIAACRAKAPKAKIVLTAIFPRNDAKNPEGRKAVLAEIAAVNAEVAKRANGQPIVYLNVNDRLADAEGTLVEGMAIDGLHMSVKGYEVWAAGLRPILTDLLGPRAEKDHAPPPTGDPSATKPDAGS